MRRLAHYVVYNRSIIVVIVLSNEMIFDIILMRVRHTISSLKLDFKRGQGCLPYIQGWAVETIPGFNQWF